MQDMTLGKQTIDRRKKSFLMKQYRLRDFRFRLVAYVVILTIIGILVIGSAKASVQDKQIVGMVGGLVMMMIFSLIDYSLFLKFRRIIYLVMVVLLAWVLVGGDSSNNATRWIEIHSFRFQPSELCKILMILFLAGFFMKYQEKLKSWLMLGISLVLVGIPAALILAEPDLSTTIVVFLVFVTLIFVAGLSYKIVLPLLAVFIPLGVVTFVLLIKQKLPFLKTYQLTRILAWRYPDQYPDEARQQLMSETAIGSGQLWGKGLNNSSITSLKNGNYLSEPQTDFIFTIVGEELGFVGCVLILILIMLIVFECILAAKNAKDLGGRLIATGVGALIGFQSFVNIGVTTGLIPNTGLPLPFVSYGLTSLISMYIGIGLVLNVGLQARRYGKSTDI